MGNNIYNLDSDHFKNGKKYKCEGYILNKKTSNIKKAHIEGEVYIYKENNSGKEKLEIKGEWISNKQQKESFTFRGEKIETKNNDKMNKSFRIKKDTNNKTNTILPSKFEIILIKYDKEDKILGRIDHCTELELNLKLLNEDIHDIQNTIFQFQKELKNNNYENKFLVINSLIGLQNLGNTSYMNSSLQILFHIPEFVELMMNNKGYDENSHIYYINQIIDSYIKNEFEFKSDVNPFPLV